MEQINSLVDALYTKFLLRDIFGKTIPGLIFLFFSGAAAVEIREIFEFIANQSLFSWLLTIGIGWLSGFAVQSAGEAFHLILFYPTTITEVWWPSSFIARQIFNQNPVQNFNIDRYYEYLDQVKADQDAAFVNFSFESDNSWYQYANIYHKASEEKKAVKGEIKSVRERMVVIKEACGNVYVSLLLSLIFISLMWIRFDWLSLPEMSWRAPLLAFEIADFATFSVLTILAFIGIWLFCRMHFVHVFRQHQTEQWRIRECAAKGVLGSG